MGHPKALFGIEAAAYAPLPWFLEAREFPHFGSEVIFRIGSTNDKTQHNARTL